MPKLPEVRAMPCAGDAETIRLPEPQRDGTRSLECVLEHRRSRRHYALAPLALAELGQLLWAAQGLTQAGARRSAPSAGALYPLELRVLAGEVSGLEPGRFHYLPASHALRLEERGDRRSALRDAALQQGCIVRGAAVLALSAVLERTRVKYGARALRYVYMEAGHAAQNVCLQAVALGLASVTVGAFDDERVTRVLGLAPGELPLYLLPVGRRRGAA